ncbi:unnamed protein product [Closterium sp. Yama58-4]|nr:unnamed protein product [Closterium sp. Yama58-4]
MSPHTECLTVGAAANSRSPDDAACVAMPGSDSTPPATLPDHILLRCLAAVPFPLYRSLHTVCAAWRRLADPLALHQIRRAEGLAELWRVDLENEYRDAAFQGLAGKARRHFSRAQPPRGLARQRSSSSNDMNQIDMSACAHHADATASCGRCRTSDDASNVRVTPLAGPLRMQYGAVGIPHEPELLVVGGRSPFPVFCREVVRAYALAHAYNALTDSWRALAPMLTARFAFGIAAWTHPSSRQTYVAVAGGYASNGEALFDAELYHVSSNTWTTLPPLTHASGACRAVVHGNQLIVAQRTGGPAESLDLAALLSTSPPALDAVAQSARVAHTNAVQVRVTHAAVSRICSPSSAALSHVILLSSSPALSLITLADTRRPRLCLSPALPVLALASLLPPIPFPASPHPVPCYSPSPSLLPPIPFPASPHPLPCFPPSRSLLLPIPFPASPHPLPCFPPSPSLLPPTLRPASPHPLPCFPPSPSLVPPTSALLPVRINEQECVY